VEEAINPSDYYYSQTSLVEIENTTNKGGGSCWDFNEILKIKQVCVNHDLGFHLDGARIWNAIAEKEESTLKYGEVFDTISVCLSKGLGCPIGSVLIGDHEIMKKAINVRKVFGGNMRQAGYLAAAGLYALEHNIKRLIEDHKKARDIEKCLYQLPFIKKVEPVETNIIIFELVNEINEVDFLNILSNHDIKIIGMGGGKLRIVTHLDYTNDMHIKFMKFLKNVSIRN
ncbi:MAG: threonine aldolase, partial [Acidimicrobiia bacterium]|nr:threonine aldolase [Acidimicrobiia bacterium]